MLTLIPATPHDMPFIRQAHDATTRPHVEAIWGWDDAIRDGFFAAYFAKENLFVIHWHNELVGAVQIHPRNDALDIAQLEIDPEYQRKGIGTAVIRDVQHQATAMATDVHLQVLKIDTDAAPLYRALGFQETGTTETHILMAWSPTSEPTLPSA